MIGGVDVWVKAQCGRVGKILWKIAKGRAIFKGT